MNYFKRISFTKILVLVSFFFTFSLTAVWFFEMTLNSDKVIKNYQEMQLEQKKEIIKNEVENAIDYLKYKKLNAENELKIEMKSKIYDAYNIAMNLYNKFKDSEPKEEVLSIIKESLREVRFFDKRGYFFILSLDGNTILHPIFPQHEGTDFLKNHKDVRGTNLHDMFKKIASSKEHEGYVDYYFYRTDDKKIEDKKIGFIKYFEPYNLYIGTSEYVKDYEKIVQKNTLNRLNEVRYGNHGYLFISDIQGNVLINPMNPELVGKNMIDYQDKSGKYIVKEFIDVANKGVGDFVYYIWPKPNSNEYTEKFTYINGFKDWNWIIGSGSHLDDVQSEIFYEALKQKDEQRERIYIFGVLMIFLILLSLYSMSWWNKRIRNSINEFISFFEKASSNNIKIDHNKILFTEFQQMAEYLNSMLDSKEKMQLELERLAVTDKLTGIYNRLKLDELLENEISRSLRYEHTFSLIIIDVDNFKSVNDNYGHPVGDKVLIQIAKILQTHIRKIDYVGRWGGEEFLIICPETDLEGSKILAENVRNEIQNANILEDRKITASFGISSFNKNDTFDSILKRADEALYHAKENGRNQVILEYLSL